MSNLGRIREYSLKSVKTAEPEAAGAMISTGPLPLDGLKRGFSPRTGVLLILGFGRIKW